MLKNIKKIVILILITTYILINLMSNQSFAINQTTTTDVNSVNSSLYPQIKEMIQSLKSKYPNWNFKILYTDIEWKDAIANEYVGHGASPRNLVPANNSQYEGDWVCQACGTDKYYDSGKWHCASEQAIAYMMDPRNSLNETDLFQFMELTYTGCNWNTIKSMVSNTFLDNDTYISAIINSAQNSNVNAYYIIARMLQEQGNSGTSLTKGQGYEGQYVGYYNVFNIGASGNSQKEIILNGLKKAQSQGWTTLEDSIIGGVQIISSSYIAKGQNTLYFQKFDVENSDGNLYWHQYMQNILAAQSEGTTLRKTFQNMGNLNGEYTFIIPVYKNMPTTACSRPSTGGNSITPGSELVKVNVTNSLKLRNEPNGSKTVAWVYKDEIVTRLVKATDKVNGTYWDYVMKSDGTKGYAARQTYDDETTYKLYLVPIEQNQPEEPKQPENPDIIQTDKVKVNSKTYDITVVPGATVNDLMEAMGNNVSGKNQNGEVLSENSKLATGSVINYTYTVVMLGDINGDGEVDTGDTYLLKLVVLEQKKLERDYLVKASDVNGDGSTDTGDTFLLKKQVLEISNITL